MDYISKDQQSRRVVPNWRFFSETMRIGELDSNRLGELDENLYSLDDYIDTWLNRKSFSTAGDLISAAISNGQRQNKYAKEAALYVTEQDTTNYPVLVSGANYILYNDYNDINPPIGNDHTELIKKLESAQNMRERIHNIRRKLNITPYNAILYVDMARTQVSIGNEEKAIKLMQVALQLAPNNRFVVRAAVRLYNHIGDFERANAALRGTSLIKYDPWLIAADISIGMKRGKNSVHIKNGMRIIESHNYHPFSYTELASSLGTLEYYFGTRKKSRVFFRTSVQAPNDNSLAQAEWVAPRIQLEFERKNNVKFDYEARFYQAFFKSNFDEAIKELVDWIIDIPYSQKPIYLGVNIALTFLRNFELAEAILRVGLKVSPNNMDFVNNMAYTLARQNKTKEAQDYLDRFLKIPDDEITTSGKACQKATHGLIAYRKGDIDLGKSLYQEAIIEAEKIRSDQPEVYYKAFINSKREELIASKYQKVECLEELKRLDLPYNSPFLRALIDEVEILYNKHQSHIIKDL